RRFRLQQRLTRRLLNVLTAASFVLCAAVLALWVRSFVAHDVVQACAVRHWVIVHSTGGLLYVFDNDFVDSQPFRATWHREPTGRGAAPPGVWRSLVGFDFHRGTPSSPAGVLVFPHWAAALLPALLPAARVDRRL